MSMRSVICTGGFQLDSQTKMSRELSIGLGLASDNSCVSFLKLIPTLLSATPVFRSTGSWQP